MPRRSHSIWLMKEGSAKKMALKEVWKDAQDFIKQVKGVGPSGLIKKWHMQRQGGSRAHTVPLGMEPLRCRRKEF